MRKSLFKAGIAVIAGVAVLALVQLTGGRADARPQYSAAFGEKYPSFQFNDTGKCRVCHGVGADGKEDKKIRNDYGKAYGAAVGGKNVKKGDPAIMAAFDKVANEKSSVDGKTFGDLIKEGKYPGKQ